MHSTKQTAYRYSLWIAGLLVVGLLGMPLTFAQEKQQQEERLQQTLATQTDPRVLIPALKQLAKLHENESMQAHYSRRHYELATQIEAYPEIYNALRSLSNYYYNRLDQRDSMLYWNQLIDSIARKRSEYPNELFLSKSYYCKDLIWKKDFETALTQAQALFELASEEQQTVGLICSTECLGLIYRAVSRNEDAVEAFQTGLEQMKDLTPQQYKQLNITKSYILDTQLRFVSLQLEACFRIGRYAQARKIADDYLQLIKEQEKLNREIGDNYPIKREYWLYHSLCIELYTLEKAYDKAAQAIEQADRYLGNVFVPGDYVELVNWFSKAAYYKATNNLPMAHYFIDKILEVERIPDELQLKADILKQEGRVEEALTIYDEIYQFDLKKNNETFFRQINQLRTLHEINERDAQKHELELAGQRIAYNKKRVVHVFTIILILLVLLYILYKFIRRTQRLKNELQHEKESLIQSEERLIRERDKAEEASRMKSTFVANMSHEIRTPLNAIVGFSELLISAEADQEEKDTYSQVIKNNTELLLTLINDVLDLSRMETGDMVFNMGNHYLSQCCQKALDSVKYHIPKDVRLSYTPGDLSTVIHTDNLRIQQLLTNFLTNAAKFTTQGEINLSYQIEPDGKNVCISVTDTGCGIPLEKQEKIFKRFEKLDDYKSGVGLGLSICGIIADRLGGHITIDPSYTAGARFLFIHPYNNPAAD